MTANQIEYWKLQETRRHNIASETMDKPVKESQTAYNYASINLLQEQAATQSTVRAMNLASAAASYASAENQYAQAQLNQERTITEQYNQQYVTEQMNYVKSQTEGQNLKNEYQGYVNTYAPSNLNYENMVNMYDVNISQFQAAQSRDRYADWMGNSSVYAWASNVSDSLGLKADTLVKSAVSLFK